MTTILAVRKKHKIVVCGDGQVSFGNSVAKASARKVKKIASGKIIVGFAGSASDGMALVERLEIKLNQYANQLMRACIELAKDWRMDKYLRRLEVLMIVADAKDTFIVSGSGDVIEPEHGVAGVGSGGNYAVAAARALMETGGDLDITAIAKKAMEIAADICVFTNYSLTIETLEGGDAEQDTGSAGVGVVVRESTEVMRPITTMSQSDMYSVIAIISVLARKVSLPYVTDVVKNLYPYLGSLVRRVKAGIASLVKQGVLEHGVDGYHCVVEELERLKDMQVDLAKIDADTIRSIRQLIKDKNV